MLSEEFTQYQLLTKEDIPSNVWKDAEIKEESGLTQYRMDVIWNYLASTKAVDGSLSFSRLSRIAKLALVIPHSNAAEERVFSMIRKNKTSFRPSLDPKGTLSSILKIKLADGRPSHLYEPTKDVLKQAKSATWEYNKQHSNKKK